MFIRMIGPGGNWWDKASEYRENRVNVNAAETRRRALGVELREMMEKENIDEARFVGIGTGRVVQQEKRISGKAESFKEFLVLYMTGEYPAERAEKLGAAMYQQMLDCGVIVEFKQGKHFRLDPVKKSG